MSARTPTRGAKKGGAQASSSVPKGELWDQKWKHMMTGRELRRVVGGEEQVGVVLFKTQSVATLEPNQHSEYDRYSAAWLDANGDWQYPDKYMTSGADTFNWTQISSMMQDRFIDHPQFPPPLKILIFPLQQNNWHALPEDVQKELDEKVREAKAKPVTAVVDVKRKRGADARAARQAALRRELPLESEAVAAANGKAGKGGKAGKAAGPNASMPVYLKGAAPKEEDLEVEEEDAAAPRAAKKQKGGQKGQQPRAAVGAAPIKKPTKAAAEAKGNGQAAGKGAKRKAEEAPKQEAKRKAPARGGAAAAAKAPAPAQAGGAAKTPARVAKAPAAGGAGGRTPAGGAKAAAGTGGRTPATRGKEAAAGPSSSGRVTRTGAVEGPAAGGKGKGKEAARQGKKDEKGKGKAPKPSGQPIGEYVGLTGRAYPPELAYRQGDRLVVDYANDYSDDAECEVDCILDEAVVGDYTLYLVKYKGYELDAGDENYKGGWEPVQHISRAVVDMWHRQDKYPGFKRVTQTAANLRVAKSEWVHQLPPIEELEAINTSSDDESNDDDGDDDDKEEDYEGGSVGDDDEGNDDDDDDDDNDSDEF